MALYNTKYHFHFPTYIPNTKIKDTFVSFFRLHLIACNPIEVGIQGIRHQPVEGAQISIWIKGIKQDRGILQSCDCRVPLLVHAGWPGDVGVDGGHGQVLGTTIAKIL